MSNQLITELVRAGAQLESPDRFVLRGLRLRADMYKIESTRRFGPSRIVVCHKADPARAVRTVLERIDAEITRDATAPDLWARWLLREALGAEQISPPIARCSSAWRIDAITPDGVIYTVEHSSVSTFRFSRGSQRLTRWAGDRAEIERTLLGAEPPVAATAAAPVAPLYMVARLHARRYGVHEDAVTAVGSESLIRVRIGGRVVAEYRSNHDKTALQRALGR